jgi:hypothetical protein
MKTSLSRIVLAVLFLVVFAEAGQTSGSAQAPGDPSVYLPLIFGPPPYGVEILNNSSSFADMYGVLHVPGEIINNTNHYLRDVTITADFYDQNNQFIVSTATNPILSSIPPYDRTCFRLDLGEPANWSYYKFQAPGYATDGAPLPALSLINSQGSYDSTYHTYDISGQIRNDSGSIVPTISPIGTLYDANNTVIDCDYVIVDGSGLLPGQTTGFTLSFFWRGDYSNVRSYRLQIDGQ